MPPEYGHGYRLVGGSSTKLVKPIASIDWVERGGASPRWGERTREPF